MTPTIHEINTVLKEKEIKLKYPLYTNSTLSVGFVLNFFSLAADLVIFVYQICQRYICMQNA